MRSVRKGPRHRLSRNHRNQCRWTQRGRVEKARLDFNNSTDEYVRWLATTWAICGFAPSAMRIAWPNLSLNPDAPSAWFRAYGASVRHRYVARFAGAPVSLPPLGRIPVSTSRSTDAEDLCGAIEALLEHLKPFVAHITDIDWKPKDGVLSLILRGMVRRQYDCLGAVTTLVRNGLGYAAAPMLRPACEEF